MSSIRVSGSVQPDTDNNTFRVVFEVAGFEDKQAALVVNREIATVIQAYFEQRLGAVAKDHGTGTPPWKVKQ